MIKRVYFCFSGLKIYSAGSDLARSADSLKKNKTRKLIHLKCEIFTLLKKKKLARKRLYQKHFEAKDL